MLYTQLAQKRVELLLGGVGCLGTLEQLDDGKTRLIDLVGAAAERAVWASTRRRSWRGQSSNRGRDWARLKAASSWNWSSPALMDT